jgi:hypothetical protein
MTENALLFELLINKSKLKPLNNNNNNNNNNNISSPLHKDVNDTSIILDEKHFISNDFLLETNQILTKHCLQSILVKNNIELFNTFLDTEMPSLLSKFDKYCMGKNE